MNFSKNIYWMLILFLFVFLLFSLFNLDWSMSWFLPIGILTIIGLLFLAKQNLENFFLTIIFIAPWAYNFNYLKINIGNFISFFSNYQITLNPISILYFVIIIVAAIELFNQKNILKQLPLKFIIIAALLLSLLSILWSGDPAASLIETVYLAVPFCLYFIAFANLNTAKSFIKIIIAIILSSIIPLVYALTQIINKTYFYEPDSSLGRLSSTMSHPNSYGLYLTVVAGLCFALFISRENKTFKKNHLLVLFSFASCLALLLTYSRTSWLSLAIYFLIFFWAEKRIAYIFAAISPLIIILLISVESIRLRIAEIFETSIFSSTTARLNIWKIAWQKIIENPWLGYGSGMSEAVIENSKTWKGGVSLPHNDYLLQWLELGVFGLFVFISYTMAAIVKTYRSFCAMANINTTISIGSKTYMINLKKLSFAILALLIALLPATIFESLSQKILIQIIIWSILGSLFGLKQQTRSINL